VSTRPPGISTFRAPEGEMRVSAGGLGLDRLKGWSYSSEYHLPNGRTSPDAQLH